MKAPRLYLSGGMTNIPNFNFDLFDAVAADLRAQGILVDSPAEHDRSEIRRLKGPGYRAEDMDGYAEGDVKRYMASIGTETEIMFVWDFAMIAEGDGIALLPGWEASTGARHERYVAEALGKDVYLVVRNEIPGGDAWWDVALDDVQHRLTNCLKTAWSRPIERVCIFNDIDAERDRQDAKFGWIGTDSTLSGDNEHAKVSVLTEEVGEVAKAVLEVQWGNDTEEHLEEELLQVAAVAVAWVEARRQKRSAA